MQHQQPITTNHHRIQISVATVAAVVAVAQ